MRMTKIKSGFPEHLLIPGGSVPNLCDLPQSQIDVKPNESSIIEALDL